MSSVDGRLQRRGGRGRWELIKGSRSRGRREREESVSFKILRLSREEGEEVNEPAETRAEEEKRSPATRV